MKIKLLQIIVMFSKYTFHFLLVICFFSNFIIAESGNAQKYQSVNDVFIQVAFKNALLSEVFGEIERNSEYVFTYNYGQKYYASVKFSQSAQKISIGRLLLNLSKQANLKFKQVNNNINVFSRENSNGDNALEITLDNFDDVLISGQITDDRNEPLAGANVIVKGTTIGTITDIDGNYTISVPEGATLTISYIGYISKEVIVGNEATINVNLTEDIQSLSEIVVVGYTEKDRRKLTSSIATVDSKQIERVPMATFDNILQGAAPGLLVQSGTGQPGRAAEVTIRGLKSINRSSAPLYILDGTPITSGDFAAINPNDIESVSILKDAAATQIYGSRGATGVIVITSKSGEKGKTKFGYNTFFGVSPAPNYNDGLLSVTSTDLIDLQQEIGIGATVGLDLETLDSLKQINTDWLDVLTRDAMIQSHELNVSGGGENTTFFISGSYFSQEGTSLRSKLDRYSLRTKVGYKNDNFSFGTNVLLSYADSQDSEGEGVFGRSNPFYSSIRVNPYDHAIDPVTGEFAVPLDLAASSTANILERIRTNNEDRTIAKGVISIYGQYNLPFIEGLSFGTQWSLDYAQRDNVDFVDPNSFRGPRSPGGQGQLFNSFERRTRFTGTNSINYNFNIGTDHQFNTALYQEFIYFSSTGTDLTVFGLDKIQTIAGATPGTADNGFIPEFDGSTLENALSSYFGTIDYSFKNRYSFTVGLRRDGSSRFGSENRFGTFYSFGAGWIISDEAFLSSLNFVNYLKLRASFGTVGNQSIPDDASRSIFSPTSYNGQTGFAAGLSNTSLKWEETEKLNIGLDLTVLNGFLNLNLDLYNEVTDDLFLEVPLSLTTGFNDQLRNVGSLRNRGVELNLSTRNIDTQNFTWETSFNIARNQTKVLQLSNGESFRLGRFLIEEEKEFGVFNLVKRAGINPANGKPLWFDLDGNLTEVYNEANSVDVGSSTPKYHGGFTNTFTYKGFELRATFTFARGQNIFNVPRTSLDNPTKISRGSISANALRFWRQPGDVSDLPDPRKVTTRQFDSGWLEDASYVKLRNVVIAYNFAPATISKIKINGLRFYLQGQNLFTWTTFSGLDPENSSTEYIADYPSLSTYTAGLDIKF